MSGSVKGLKVMISAADPADPALPTVTLGTIHEPTARSVVGVVALVVGEKLGSLY